MSLTRNNDLDLWPQNRTAWKDTVMSLPLLLETGKAAFLEVLFKVKAQNVVLSLYARPHQLVGTGQTARGVCCSAAPPGWNGPALRGCWRPTAPPLSGPGSDTASWSRRRSACGQSHHSALLVLETWPGAKSERKGTWGWEWGWAGGGQRVGRGGNKRKLWE